MHNLQIRASEAIGGVVSFIRREEAGHPAAPQIKRSPVRFHNTHAVQKRKDGDGKGGKNDPAPAPPLNPFSTTAEKRDADLTRRKDPQESVPPLAPFSTGGKKAV